MHVNIAKHFIEKKVLQKLVLDREKKSVTPCNVEVTKHNLQHWCICKSFGLGLVSPSIMEAKGGAKLSICLYSPSSKITHDWSQKLNTCAVIWARTYIWLYVKYVFIFNHDLWVYIMKYWVFREKICTNVLLPENEADCRWVSKHKKECSQKRVGAKKERAWISVFSWESEWG